MAVDHIYFISFLMLRFPYTWKVASLFCHSPSNWIRARSSPFLTKSIICRDKFWYPHLLKCCPSSELRFCISCLGPPCLISMKLMLFPGTRSTSIRISGGGWCGKLAQCNYFWMFSLPLVLERAGTAYPYPQAYVCSSLGVTDHLCHCKEVLSSLIWQGSV